MGDTMGDFMRLTATPDHLVEGKREEDIWHLTCECGWSDNATFGMVDATVAAHVGEYSNEQYDTHEEKRGK